ncbi:MAG: FAD-dependent oxidoreductase [Pseudomonadota bacterium]
MNKQSIEKDIVIVGSGAAGMCAAIVARLEGLDVLLVEKTKFFGGTTALSGAGTWIPLNHLGAQLGVADDKEKVMTYLRNVVGDTVPEVLHHAFLKHGPRMLRYMEEKTELKFSGRKYSPDYLPEVDGAGMGGRAMDPLEFDGRSLGPHFDMIRKPWPEFLAFGGMMVNRLDIDLLLTAKTSLKGFRHALKLLGRFSVDRLRGYSRGTRLLMGNAMIGRLYKTLLDLKVELWNNAPAQGLIRNDGRIAGVVVMRDGVEVEVRVRKGVVLATGGFPFNREMREKLLPQPTGMWSAGNEHNTGDGIRIAEAVGGHLATGNTNNAFYTPVSMMQRKDGSTARFPHLMLDRYKPGIIMVNQDGKRFVNEANSYHACGEAQYKNNPDGAAVPSYFICDADFLKKYGVGMVRPQAASIRGFIDSGYLVRADSIGALADKLKINRSGLEQTVANYNRHAEVGDDPEFGKGGNVYNRYLGDPDHKPNACLAPIRRGPFYAVEFVPGDIGTACGLVTDEYARVLDEGGVPVGGLYAAGNDMNSIMGGNYPGPGITIGPGLTFGYIAARHMAGTLGD